MRVNFNTRNVVDGVELEGRCVDGRVVLPLDCHKKSTGDGRSRVLGVLGRVGRWRLSRELWIVSISSLGLWEERTFPEEGSRCNIYHFHHPCVTGCCDHDPVQAMYCMGVEPTRCMCIYIHMVPACMYAVISIKRPTISIPNTNQMEFLTLCVNSANKRKALR